MRLANRLLAAVLSLALACAAALLIAEIAADRLGNRTVVLNWHPAYAWAARTDWVAGSLRVSAVVLVVLGLILLLAELKPARVARLPADPAGAGAAGMDTAYTRRGVATATRSAVTDVDGIRTASVRVTRRRVAVTAVADALDKAAAQAVRDTVTAAARDRLTALSLRRTPALSVRVTPRRN
jgi:hypothetical protein